MSDIRPKMYVFAGNNGSGKSTIRNLLIDRIGLSINIDPDAIARRINPSSPASARVSAGKESIQTARECIKSRRDFSIETTLSGGYALRLIKKAIEHDFEIIMYYIGLNSPSLNIKRVAIRVRNGGHHIPSEDILKRRHTSLRNLIQNLHLINHLLVIDNSAQDGEVVIEAKNGKLVLQVASLPKWVVPIKDRMST